VILFLYADKRYHVIIIFVSHCQKGLVWMIYVESYLSCLFKPCSYLFLACKNFLNEFDTTLNFLAVTDLCFVHCKLLFQVKTLDLMWDFDIIQLASMLSVCKYETNDIFVLTFQQWMFDLLTSISSTFSCNYQPAFNFHHLIKIVISGRILKHLSHFVVES
jgi:hypothetical protein